MFKRDRIKPLFSTFLIHYNLGSPRNDIAALYGARFVKAAESQHRASMDEALIKEITGSDTISARFLYAEHFSFEPQFKLWLATNHKPRIKGPDEAIWRRTRLIPFTQRFEGKAKDRHLLKKLKAELAGILAWAVQGCKEWQRSGLGMPAAIAAATQEYRAESDLVGIFIGEECVVGRQLSVGAKDLYMSYRNWAGARNEEVVPSSVFSSDMLQRRFTKTRVGKGVMYHGLALQSRPDYGPSIRPSDFKKGV